LQTAPSGYRRYAAKQHNPALRCARAIRDDELMPQIQRIWQANMQAYGADKVFGANPSVKVFRWRAVQWGG